MAEQTIGLSDVIGHLSDRLDNLNDGKAFITSRKDELLRLRRHFLDLVKHEVTFVEENEEASVTINIYSDEGMETAVTGSPKTTDSDGEATIILTKGPYYFKATKADFENYIGSFTVVDDDLIVGFEMVEEDKGKGGGEG